MPFLLLFLTDREKTNTTKSKSEEDKQSEKRKLPNWVCVVIYVWVSLLYFLYCCVDDTFGAFFMSFVVREFDEVSKSQGAYILSIFWTCFAVSRFVMIFLARVISPARLLMLCGAILITAFSRWVEILQHGGVRFGCKVGHIVSLNGTNPGLFHTRFQYILALGDKIIWNLIWKSPGFVPFKTNLTLFEQNLASLKLNINIATHV